MAQVTVLALALVLAGGAAGLGAQEADDVKQLKQEIESLRAQLAAANQKVTTLEQENKQLKADAAGKPTEKPAAKDPFAKGAAFSGFRLSGSGKKQSVELVVTKRDGTSFEGQLTLTTDDKADRKVIVTGTATTGKTGLVRFKTEKSGKFEQTFSGQFNNGTLGFDFAGTDWLGAARQGSGEIKAKVTAEHSPNPKAAR